MNNRRWFHANVPDAQTAEAVLKKNGFNGSFLVRHSKGSKGDFSLAVRREDKVVHVKIRHDEEGYAVENGETFATLTELVDSYASGVEALQEKNGKAIILGQPLNCDDPTSERWYHGHIRREIAEKLLMDSGNTNAFLVRQSTTRPGDYVIVIRCEDTELINVIVEYKDSQYYVPGEGDFPKFGTISELIEYYRYHGLACKGGKQLRLVKPVNTTRVNVGAISERVTALKNDKDLPVMGRAAGFSEEFERLQKQEGMNLHGRVEGRKPENTAKNRYKNILPFDTTRVVLTDGDPDVPGSDYINANYLKIDVRGEGCQYIATQGCLQNTIVDFWRMIWQENVSIIVMLTKLMEGSKNKCSRYWPNNSEGQKVLYMYDGQLTVKLREQSKTNDYEVNELELTKRIVKGDQVEDSDTRTVCHFHFLAWPDKSVPKDPGPLIDFMKAVTDKRRDINRIEPMGPIVVHCSAGIGRTGAYIVLDALLYHIDKHGLNCEIDIQKVVEEARAQRSGMVQTEEQYKFLYEVIKHYSETQKKRMVTQHLTSDEVPQEYGNLYFTKNGLKQSCSVPLSGASVSKPILSSEPVYENASAKFATSALSKEAGDAKASACPVYENARSNKRR